jgi:hypothetical protein
MMDNKATVNLVLRTIWLEKQHQNHKESSSINSSNSLVDR